MATYAVQDLPVRGDSDGGVRAALLQRPSDLENVNAAAVP